MQVAPAVAELAAALGGEPAADQALGAATVDVSREQWRTALTQAREGGFTYFDWLSAVDETSGTAAGVRVVAHVYAPGSGRHLLLRTLLPPGDLRVATTTGVYDGANWHEREAAEMFGVVFDGHPDPRPLLLPVSFEGHPLRKDFVLAARVARPWPGAIEEPGKTGRRRAEPPGVPPAGTWPTEEDA